MKAFFDNIKKNHFYKVWFKDALPYITGAVLLSVFQIVTFATTGSPWGVSGVLTNWGAWIFRTVGGSVDTWFHFSSTGAQANLDAGVLNNAGSWRNIGLIFGALFATLMASGFKFKKIKSMKQVLAAILGGLLMGYGARVALGCNIGALYSSIAVGNLAGWVFAVFLLVGAIIGSKLLMKFFM